MEGCLPFWGIHWVAPRWCSLFWSSPTWRHPPGRRWGTGTRCPHRSSRPAVFPHMNSADQCCEPGMIYSGSNSDLSSGSDLNYFKNIRKFKKKNQPTTFNEHSAVFSVQLSKKEVPIKLPNILITGILFLFRLDPDPKQIIPDPDPGKSFGSNRIRIHNTGMDVESSVAEPEPDFLAGTGAGEKAPAPGCCCLA